MNEHQIQLIKAGFKLVCRFLMYYCMDISIQGKYTFAYQSIREELEEIVNKL